MDSTKLPSNLDAIAKLLEQCLESLRHVERTSFTGTFIHLFICNPDVIQSRTSYLQASILLQQIEARVLNIPNPQSFKPSAHPSHEEEHVYSSWRYLQDFPYAKTIEALNGRYGGSDIYLKLETLKPHLEILKEFFNL